MRLICSRLNFLIAFLFAAVVMAAALYLEYVVGLAPCPLCIAQRLCIIGFGLTGLTAAIHNPAILGFRIYTLVALFFVLLGGSFAWRQIWLQTLPPEALPSCLPSLEYMLEVLPFQEILSLFLQGTADCAEVNWTFLTLSLPEWSLLVFIALTLGCLWQLLLTRRPSH